MLHGREEERGGVKLSSPKLETKQEKKCKRPALSDQTSTHILGKRNGGKKVTHKRKESILEVKGGDCVFKVEFSSLSLSEKRRE